MTQIIWIVVFAAFIYMKHIRVLTLKIIPERAMVKHLNEKYIYNNGTIYVIRHGRKSGYYINIEATLKTTFGNNVTLNLMFFEFLHNEYKPSFVEMHFKICDGIKSDPYVGQAFKRAGLECPVSTGTHRIMNISVPADEFPNVWPFEKCKVEASLTQTQTAEVIAKADIYILFKQKLRTG